MVAFPSISTGAYSYPVEAAAKLALATVATFLENAKRVEEVRFILFSARVLKVYEAGLASLKL